VRRLDMLAANLRYEPITTDIMRRAAHLWARSRQAGRPTADRSALDGDMILAATALALADRGHDPVIATGNVGHLGAVAPARRWQDIEP
jgi:hypothetical protein